MAIYQMVFFDFFEMDKESFKDYKFHYSDEDGFVARRDRIGHTLSLSSFKYAL